MSDDKLTDLERDAIRKQANKYFRRSLWVSAASLAAWAGAIWFGDWRYAGIGTILFLVAAAIFGVSHAMTSKSNEARFASTIRTAQRAKKEKADRERRKVEDLERDLGMRD